MGCDNTRKTALRSMKKGLLLSFLCVLALGLLSGLPREFQVQTAIHPSPIYNLSSIKNVTILLWHWPYGRPFRLRGDVCMDLYRISHCRLVDQRSLFSSADVVVFHNRELIKGIQKLPVDLPRPQHQRWAWMSLEASDNNGNLQQYANIFNMTIAYRRDADIRVPYGEQLPKETEGHLVEDIPPNKRFLACWVVSNYISKHKRSQVFRELNATVPVNVYGRWTKTRLPSSALLPTISHCYFYLAFENSLSKDYITEKLWRNAYLGGAVPVVLGPPLSDYKALVPPNSFIHVDEFASVKDLGKFLQQLAEDKKRYSEYFAWKHNWEVKLYRDWRERLCKICTQYNSLPQQKVYSDLQAWNDAGNC